MKDLRRPRIERVPTRDHLAHGSAQRAMLTSGLTPPRRVRHNLIALYADTNVPTDSKARQLKQMVRVILATELQNTVSVVPTSFLLWDYRQCGRHRRQQFRQSRWWGAGDPAGGAWWLWHIAADRHRAPHPSIRLRLKRRSGRGGEARDA